VTGGHVEVDTSVGSLVAALNALRGKYPVRSSSFDLRPNPREEAHLARRLERAGGFCLAAMRLAKRARRLSHYVGPYWARFQAGWPQRVRLLRAF
jgi:hypothetical protein